MFFNKDSSQCYRLTSQKFSFTVFNMKSSRRLSALKILTALFFFTTLSIQISAQAKLPSFEPLFIININSTTYTADEVFETALLYSECERNSEVWKRCWQKFKTIKQTLTSEEYQNLAEEERGRAILKYLYGDYLKAYELNQTRLDVALETGKYNCVSSAILYMAAAKAAGLTVRGQRTTQHAFCSIYVPGAKPGQVKKIDVETTNPYGFNPGSKEEVENENKIKQYYVVPKKYYSNRAEVSDGIFTGLIAGNLTSEYIKSGNYEKALPLGAARWNAIKDEPAKSTASVRNEFDILATNYVNLLPQSAAAYSPTLDWFLEFINRWGSTEFLQKNLDTAVINLFILCFQEKNYPLAQSAYEKYISEISQSQQITKAEEIITDIIITNATENLTTEEKIAQTNNLLATEDLSTPARQKRAQMYLESFWLESLNDLMNSRDYENGYATAAQALSQLPKSSKIKTMQNGFYNNCITVIHNNFARLANSGDYEQALSILEEGLQKFPNNKTLKKDLTDLQKISN